MSSLEEWNRAKQSGQYTHPETEKNWPLNPPTEPAVGTEIPPDPRPKTSVKEPAKEPSSFSWYKLLLMLLVMYCAALLTYLAFFVTKGTVTNETVIKEKVKVVKVPVKTPPLPPEILTVNYDAYCPSFGDVPTCERLLKRLKLTQEKNKALIRQGQRPSSTITL